MEHEGIKDETSCAIRLEIEDEEIEAIIISTIIKQVNQLSEGTFIKLIGLKS